MNLTNKKRIIFLILIFIVFFVFFVFFILGFIIGMRGLYFPFYNKFEKFSIDNQTYQLVNLTDYDKGNEYSDRFDINPLLTGTHKTTPLEFENEAVD
jgi:hypothetical protein